MNATAFGRSRALPERRVHVLERLGCSRDEVERLLLEQLGSRG